MDSIGKRIKFLRKLLKISQKDFAKKIGVNQAFISRIEREENRPSDKILRLISHTFGVRYEWLKEGEGEIWEKKKEVPSWLKEFLEKASDLDVETMRVVAKMLKEMNEEDKKLFLKFLEKWSKGIEKRG